MAIEIGNELALRFASNMKRNGNHKNDDYSQRTSQPNRKQIIITKYCFIEKRFVDHESERERIEY